MHLSQINTNLPYLRQTCFSQATPAPNALKENLNLVEWQGDEGWVDQLLMLQLCFKIKMKKVWGTAFQSGFLGEK